MAQRGSEDFFYDAKRHVRLQGSRDDIVIAQMIEAALDHLRSLDVDVDAETLPPALHHAVLLLVGHFFLNREATTAETLRFTPIGVDRLIAPYRKVSL